MLNIEFTKKRPQTGGGFYMWAEELDNETRRALNMISGGMNLPPLSSFSCQAAFLAAVYSRILEAKALGS